MTYNSLVSRCIYYTLNNYFSLSSTFRPIIVAKRIQEILGSCKVAFNKFEVRLILICKCRTGGPQVLFPLSYDYLGMSYL